MPKKVCVLGLGYIGLPTAAILATNGFKVLGVDINPKVVQTINNGDIHIEEPGLKTIVEAAVKSKNLTAALKPEKADVFIISVPTPITKEKKADLSYVRAACKSLVNLLEKDNLVVLESTSPPGTTEELATILNTSSLKAGNDFFLAHCPERVLPGKILKEIIENDRIIGGINHQSSVLAQELYQNFVAGKIYLTSATTAEFVKLIENTYRDVNIAFANELAKICQALGIDVWEAISLANRHPRVNIHCPGPGVGGHCIAVDPWFLIESAPEFSSLIKLSRETNDGMPDVVVSLIKDKMHVPRQAKLTIFGLAYKANIDDARESPAIKVVEKLLAEGYQIKIFDPYINDHAKFNKLLCSNSEEALEGSEALVILTDHDEFKNCDPTTISNISKSMKKKVVLDTRNCLSAELWQAAGFKVFLLGSAK